jgi:amino-acid N-acetyltransferase
MEICDAVIEDVPVIRELINRHAEREKMLFRSLANLYGSLRDFMVCHDQGRVVGCCALSIVWADLAEVRSLAVDENYQKRGIGRLLVTQAVQHAKELHMPGVFTLTLEPGFFEKLGFKRVAMDQLPHKVWSDCVYCPKKDHCDEVALVLNIQNT